MHKNYYNYLMWLYGLLFIIIGVVLIAFNRQVYNFTGQIDFIESKFPTGTLSFIKLFAVLMIVVGICMFTGLLSFITDPLTESLRTTIGGANLQK